MTIALQENLTTYDLIEYLENLTSQVEVQSLLAHEIAKIEFKQRKFAPHGQILQIMSACSDTARPEYQDYKVLRFPDLELRENDPDIFPEYSLFKAIQKEFIPDDIMAALPTKSSKAIREKIAGEFEVAYGFALSKFEDLVRQPDQAVAYGWEKPGAYYILGMYFPKTGFEALLELTGGYKNPYPDDKEMYNESNNRLEKKLAGLSSQKRQKAIADYVHREPGHTN